MTNELNLFAHKIISINIGRDLSHLYKLDQYCRLGRVEWPSVICIQDAPKRCNVEFIVRTTLGTKYEAISSPRLNERSHNNSNTLSNQFLIEGDDPYASEHIIMYHREMVDLISEPYLMPRDMYDRPKATGIGVSLALRSFKRVTLVEGQDYGATLVTNMDEKREIVELFSLYIRPHAEDEETETLLEWVRVTANEKGRGIAKSIIVGDFNATNPLWNKMNQNTSAEEAIEEELEHEVIEEQQHHLDNGSNDNDNHRNQSTSDRATRRTEFSIRKYINKRDTRGRRVFHFIRRNKMYCLNSLHKEPTTNRSCIDLVIVGSKIEYKFKELPLMRLALKDWSMNKHLALISTYIMKRDTPSFLEDGAGKSRRKRRRIMSGITTNGDDGSGGSTMNMNRVRYRKVTRYNIGRINEEMFQFFKSDADRILANWQTAESKRLTWILDELMKLIYDQLLEVQRQIMVTKLIKASNKQSKPTLRSNQGMLSTKTATLMADHFRRRISIENGRLIRKAARVRKKLRETKRKELQLEHQFMNAILIPGHATLNRLRAKRRRLRQRRRRLVRKLRRLKMMTFSQVNRKIMRQNVQELRTRLKRARTGGFNLDQYYNNDDDPLGEPDNFWDRVHQHEQMIERIKGADKSEIDNRGKDKKAMADILCNQDIDEIARQNFPSNRGYQGKRLVESMIEKHTQDHSGRNNIGILISEQQIELAIKELRYKKYVTPEGIRMEVFHACINNFIKSYVIITVYLSFKLCHIPKICKQTKGTLIPKREPGKYRIVHVSSPMAALLERVALHHLEYTLDHYNLNDKNQYGFSAGRDRHDLIAKTMHLIMMDKWNFHARGQQRPLPKSKRITTIIGLDIQGAFDNVNHEHLLKKLDQSPGLSRSNLRFWLAKFIIDRNITLRYKKFHSRPREICKGVPQGSALGPILFNLAINQIRIRQDYARDKTSIRLLKYADDLHIVQKGYDQREMQQALDNITRQLHEIGLIINPTKCSCLPITFGNNNLTNQLNHSDYMIRNWTQSSDTNNETVGNTGQILFEDKIKVTQSLNILGVMVNHRLTLDRKAMMVKLELATSKLFHIQIANIIHRAIDWRIIINSYLSSVSTLNSWPMLIVNPSDRKWLDKILSRCLKLVFNWPVNVSVKRVRLLLDYHKCDLTILEILKVRACKTTATDLVKDYTSLVHIMQRSMQTETEEIDAPRATRNLLPFNELLDIENNENDPAHYYANPDDMLRSKTTQIVCIDEDHLRHWGPFWFIMARKWAGMAIETEGHVIVAVKLVVNSTYRIPYFNEFSLLWHLIRDRSITNRKLVLPKSDPLLLALRNFSNRDHRVIKLRHMIHEFGWELYELDLNLYRMIRENMQRLAELTSLKHVRTPNFNHRIHEVTIRQQREHLEAIRRFNARRNPDGDPNLIGNIVEAAPRLDDGFYDSSGDDDNDGNNPLQEQDRDTEDLRCRRQQAGQLRLIPRIFNNIESEWANFELICEHTQTPDFTDYLAAHLARKRVSEIAHDRMACEYMGKLCHSIVQGRYKILQDLCPSWLSGPTMLTLSDLYREGTRFRLRKNNGDIRQCEICQSNLTMDPHTSNSTPTNLIAHRASTQCTGFAEQSTALRELLESENNNMRMVTRDRRKLYKLIKIYTECAFNRPNRSVATRNDEDDNETVIDYE